MGFTDGFRRRVIWEVRYELGSLAPELVLRCALLRLADDRVQAQRCEPCSGPPSHVARMAAL
ncbi:hypothetical protein AAVH_32085, partial [Aphelenchoides avenae]